MKMTIDELYQKMEDKSFQDTSTGTMFYNVYIFQYPAEEEYHIYAQIDSFKSRLRRPSNNLDILTLDIFEEFCHYLDEKPFGKHSSMLNYLLHKEIKSPESVNDTLVRNACDEKFFEWMDTRIKDHLNTENELAKSFVFLYGFGQIFPYLRTNTFLSNFERYNHGEEYKIIVFYPGNVQDNSFSLFGVLKDDHTYRSIKLINE
jgi:hypothetical protein